MDLIAPVPTVNILYPTYTTNAWSVPASASGATILLGNPAAASTIALPALSAGLNFRFVATATLTSTSTITINAPSACYQGGIIITAGTPTVLSVHGSTHIVLVVSGSLPGDTLSVFSDGTSYFVTGVCAATVTTS